MESVLLDPLLCSGISRHKRFLGHQIVFSGHRYFHPGNNRIGRVLSYGRILFLKRSDRMARWAVGCGRTFGTDSPFPPGCEIDAAALKNRKYFDEDYS
jgi:hypothetical protein